MPPIQQADGGTLETASSHAGVMTRVPSTKEIALEKLIGGVQKLTVMALAGMLVVVMLLSTVHLAVLIGQEIWKPPRWLIPVQGLLEILDTSCWC